MKRPVSRKSTNMVVLPGSTRFAVPQAKRIKKSDPKLQIKISVYARQNPAAPGKDRSPLDRLNNVLPRDRKYMSDQDFNSTFGADPADLAKIAAWAQASKLKVLASSVPMRRVLVQGSIRDISKALDVELNDYVHPQTGRFRGRVGQIHIPADLSGVVQGVFGLDTRNVGRPRIRRGNFQPVDIATLALGSKKKNGAVTVPASPFPGAFFPPAVSQLYAYPGQLTGSGQNVAIFAFNGTGPDPHGGYKLSALQNYFVKVLGGDTPTITDVVVQGPGNDPGPDTNASSSQGDSTGEVMLDMCVVGSVAPGASIFMYFTEFTSQGWVDALNQAITDQNQIAVISISYGNPEDDPQGAWTSMGVQNVNLAVQAAAAKGITICCASGDDGSNDGDPPHAHVDFPASSPFVLGVGGTTLVASSGTAPTIQSETVWNEVLHSEGATGGGVSDVFTKPAYQNSVNVLQSANPPHAIGRGVPDVAAVADPVTGVVVMDIDGKHLEQIGGTSASTPLWASLVARLNQGLNARCGFLNPLLYGKFSSGVLRDITVGNNGAYSAGPGWDACTGLGSPNGDRLFQVLSGADTQTQASAALG